MIKNTYNQKIIVAGSAIIVLALMTAILLIQSKCRQIAYYNQTKSQAENVGEIKLKTYTNRPLKYRLSYPGNLDVISLENNGVVFSQGGGPGISIQVFAKQQFPDAESWLETENKKLKSSRYLKDENIDIAGQSGISAHEVANNGEDFPDPQIIIFSKDSNIFVITAPLASMPTIIDSLVFEE
ncbi:MAG: hypothetical protein PHG95_00180 [Patescibacteria group bacterium]|nr:hypothetical protein [Patescibacteria group bacterium]